MGFGVRLIFGMHVPLESDESTTALTALGITRGHFVLTEVSAHYQGAVESYIMAPFIAVLGPTQFAVRLTLALVGVGYVLAMFGLGRSVFGRVGGGLTIALVAAVFPLFEIVWTMHGRSGYAELVGFEALCLLLAIQIGWRDRGQRLRWWALFGLVAGLAMWSYLSIALTLAVIGIALLCRGPVIGWRTTLRGAAVAAVTALIGFAPWLAYNVTHKLAGLHGLPKYETSVLHAVNGLINKELPLFVGTWGACSDQTVIPLASRLATWLILGAVTAAVVWRRRRQLAQLLRLHVTTLEPEEMVMAIAPAVIISVTVGRFNGTACEPRFMLPFAIPLVLAAGALFLASRWQKVVAVLLTLIYLPLAIATAAGHTVDSIAYAPGGVTVPADPSPAVALMHENNVSAIIGFYWLIRPVQFADGATIPAAEYQGYVAFPDSQHAALTAAHPSWLFAAGDPTINRLRAEEQRRGITSTEVSRGGYVLFANLSAPITPNELGVGPS